MAEETIYLAGGCFWGLEELLGQLEGVLATEVGYMGGELKNPGYRDICQGDTGHAESSRVVFDNEKTSLAVLFDWFFRMHDPTTLHRQGNDVGSQYRSAIFLSFEEQRSDAEMAIQRAHESGRWSQPIVTEVGAGKELYSAEEEHQKYLKKNPGGYSCHYIRD